MVDPARHVAAAIGIDDERLIEREQERVAGFQRAAVTLIGLGMGNPLALVKTDVLASGDRRPCEYAIAMDAGTPTRDALFHAEIFDA